MGRKIGSQRMGGIRLGYPDFSRSGTDSGAASALADVPTTSTAHDADSQASSLATADVPLSAVIHESTESDAAGRAGRVSVRVDADATSGDGQTAVGVLRVRVRSDVSGGFGAGLSDIPTTGTRHGISESDGSAKSDIPTIATVHTVADGIAESRAGVTNSISIAISEASVADAESGAPVTSETWKAGIGGVVTSNGSGVGGAEVQVIRDNDDTLVRSVITGSDGRWHVTLPAGSEPDPEVYVVEAYYRDGPKRDPDADLFNATNRPYIDTADPSSRTPYDDDSQTNYGN